MSGVTVRQAGPLGVSNAIRTAPGAPRQRAVADATGSAQTGLGEHDFLTPDPSGGPRRDDRDDWPSGAIPVAPGTLFAASLLAPSQSPAFSAASVLRAASEAWAPPSSSLSLRDRTV